MSFFFKIISVSFIVLFTTVPSSATTQKKEKEKEVVMDTIHVNGMVLKGKITNLGPEKLSFSLVNIDGNNHIPYKDIDAIHSKHNYTISYGDEKIKGKVVGIVDQKSLKIESAGTTKVVKISEIDRFVMSLENDDSTENRMKHTLPYISGNVHLGLEFDHGAKKQDTINIYMDLLRKKAKHETYFHFDYEFETTEVPDKPKVESEDELAAILGHRYFYDPNNFLYTAILGEFDRPRNIDARYVLDAGYGHKYTFGKGKWIQPWLGLGYVWTRYVENDIYPDKGYTAAALGLNGVYQFNDVKWINRLKLDGEVLYYPSLSNPDEDWLLRSRFGITVPIYEFFSVKLNVKWVNDSNPDPSIGNNKTETDILFGFSF
ncbi:MAG: DUF481 domain-containing protein [Sulfurovum sp.]